MMVLPMKHEKLLPSAWPLLARAASAERRRRRETRALWALTLIAAASILACLVECLR